MAEEPINPLFDYSFPEESNQAKPAPVGSTAPPAIEQPRKPPQGNPLLSYSFPEKEKAASEYTNMPLSEAAMRGVQKFPESAVTTAKSMVEPFYPSNIPQTAVNLGQLGYGAVSKGLGALGIQESPEKKAQDEAVLDAVMQQYKERYGSGEGFKKAIAEDPAGVMSDVFGVATGAARAPGLVGGLGRTTQAVVGAPLTAPIKAAEVAVKAPGEIGLGALRTASGLSAETLAEARRAGHTNNPAFWASASGEIPTSKIVDTVRNTINDVVQERSDNYLSKMSDLRSRNDILPFNNVDNALLDARSRVFSGPAGIEMNSQAAAALKDATAKVNEFKKAAAENPFYQTIEGFDHLKRALDDIGSNYMDPTAKDVISNARNAAKKVIADKDPRYAEIMDEYAAASGEIREFEKELIARRQGKTTGQDLRTLLRAQKNPYKKELLDELEKRNPDLGALIAGQEVAQAHSPRMPQMLASAAAYGVSPLALMALPFTSPQIAAKTAYGLGKLERPFTLPSQMMRGAIPQSIMEQMPTRAELATPAILAGRTGLREPVEGQVEFMPERQQRKSGGRTLSMKTTADSLIAATERAKKKIQSDTKPLLDEPDEHVVSALKVANNHI